MLAPPERAAFAAARNTPCLILRALAAEIVVRLAQGRIEPQIG